MVGAMRRAPVGAIRERERDGVLDTVGKGVFEVRGCLEGDAGSAWRRVWSGGRGCGCGLGGVGVVGWIGGCARGDLADAVRCRG